MADVDQISLNVSQDGMLPEFSPSSDETEFGNFQSSSFENDSTMKGIAVKMEKMDLDAQPAQGSFIIRLNNNPASKTNAFPSPIPTSQPNAFSSHHKAPQNRSAATTFSKGKAPEKAKSQLADAMEVTPPQNIVQNGAHS